MQNKMVLYSKYSIALWRWKVWAVEFFENIGWKIWWIGLFIVSLQPKYMMLHAVKRTSHVVKRISHVVKRTFHAVKYTSDRLSADFCIGYRQRFITAFIN